MEYLVVVKKRTDGSNLITKVQYKNTREEADAQVEFVKTLGIMDAFVIDEPESFSYDFATVDMTAKTINYHGPEQVVAKALEDWKTNMAETDLHMSRSLEDMLDGMADKSNVAQITLDKLQAKKDLRATKPE